jgi:hypothetical protein
MTVKAVFASKNSKAWFLVDGQYYDDLNVAVTKGTKVVLAADGTLSAGNYTIPAGVTLLIPYDSANTLCTTKPYFPSGTAGNNIYATPSVYRTLTMAEGANVTIKGAMSLSSATGTKQGYTGAPSGPQSIVNMLDGSTITVKNGGFLYFNGTDLEINVSGSTYTGDGTKCVGMRVDKDYTQTDGNVAINVLSNDATGVDIRGTKTVTGGTLKEK